MFSHFYKRPNDKDAHLNGLLTTQKVRRHDGSILDKDPGEFTHAAMP